MAKYKNSKRESFLNSIPIISLDDDSNNLTIRCKFNFSYFTIDEAGQDFKDWSQNELSKLLDKLKEYSKFSLNHWEHCKKRSKSDTNAGSVRTPMPF